MVHASAEMGHLVIQWMERALVPQVGKGCCVTKHVRWPRMDQAACRNVTASMQMDATGSLGCASAYLAGLGPTVHCIVLKASGDAIATKPAPV